MKIDTHVFGSKSGYECLSKSLSVTNSENEELSQFGFGQSSDNGFLDGLLSNPTALGRMLASGRYALTRVFKGKPDVANRVTLEFRTLLFRADQFLSIRSALPDLVKNLRVWESSQFGAGESIELSVPAVPQPHPSEWSWRIFDAWFSMQARRPHCILIESEFADEVLKMPAVLDEKDDALTFSWGIGMLRPVHWVDITVLSPYGKKGTDRPAFGISRGQCVNPRIESEHFAHPRHLPSLMKIQIGDALTNSDETISGKTGDAIKEKFSPKRRNPPLPKGRKTLAIWVALIVVSISALLIGVFFVTKSLTAIPSPMQVKASDETNCEFIDVTWNEVKEATAYRVTRIEYITKQNVRTQKERKQFDTDAKSFNYQDKEALPGIEYEYSVQTICNEKASSPSASDKGRLADRPSKPEGLSVSIDKDTGQVKLIWKADENFLNYTITRQNGTDKIKIPNIPSTEWTDDNGSHGVKYTYSVRAETSVGPSAESTSVVGTRRLDQVVKLTAQGSASGIKVSWESDLQATSYTVSWEYTDINGKFQKKERSIKKPEFDFTDTTAIPGILYTYSIVAKAPGADSIPSENVPGTRPIQPPQGLTASNDKPGEVRLEWTAPSGASLIPHNYEITRSDGKILDAKTELKLTDKDVAPGVVYTYKVKAFVADANSTKIMSEESNPATGLAVPKALPAPVVTKVTTDLAEVVRIEWVKLQLGTILEIERTDTKGVVKKIPAPGDAGFYEDRDAEPNEKYTYICRYTDAGISSSDSLPKVGNYVGSFLSKEDYDDLDQFFNKVEKAKKDALKELGKLLDASNTMLTLDSEWTELNLERAKKPQWSEEEVEAFLKTEADIKKRSKTSKNNFKDAATELNKQKKNLQSLKTEGGKNWKQYEQLNVKSKVTKDLLISLVKSTLVCNLLQQCSESFNKLDTKKIKNLNQTLTDAKLPENVFDLFDNVIAPASHCSDISSFEQFNGLWDEALNASSSEIYTQKIHDKVKNFLETKN